jgi:hypothetical protein
MKRLFRLWTRFYPVSSDNEPEQKRTDDSAATLEFLKREVRRNLAGGMSLRDAVQAAQATVEMEHKLGTSCRQPS